MMNINTFKEQFDKRLPIELRPYLNDDVISEAIEYASYDAGKRLRPFILYSLGRELELDKRLINAFAVALELIHNYSLVHDDLPAMDNDDYRRGKFTVHKKYGEANAILCGDALLNLSMEYLAHKLRDNDNKNILKAMSYMYGSSGVKGMILGQSQDIRMESGETGEHTYDEYKVMILNKTGRLFNIAFLVPCILADKDEDTMKNVLIFSRLFAMSFQIKDDLDDLKENKEIDGNNILKFHSIEEAKEILEENLKKMKALQAKLNYETTKYSLELIK